MTLARMVLAMVLTCTPALAAEDSVAPWDVATEDGALRSLEGVVRRMDAALPSLTPDQLAYYKREQQFIDEQLKHSATWGKRTEAFHSSKEFRLQKARDDLALIRRALARAKAAAGRKSRFVDWVEVVVALSRVEQWESSLESLAHHAVLGPADIGMAEGVNWLKGQEAGQVQMLWGYWAEAMWNGFVRDGLAAAVTATPPSQ